MIVENRSIIEYCSIKADAIAFEVSCTTKIGGYVSRIHPRCYDAIIRVFGKEWLYVLGANLKMRLDESKENIYLKPVPMGYVWGKLLIGLPIKPDTTEVDGYDLSEDVKVPKDIMPGYLLKTKLKDIESSVRNLLSFVDLCNMKKIIVSPSIQTDSYLNDFADVGYIYNQYLDDRFIIARKGF